MWYIRLDSLTTLISVMQVLDELKLKFSLVIS